MTPQSNLLRTVLETAVDGVILIDRIGTILMFNPACERLFGYRADDVIGENVRVLMPEPYRKEHDDYLRNYQETGKAKIIGIGREVLACRRDGVEFPIDLSVSEAKQGGEPIYVGIIHDLTERKKMERQLVHAQKMEAVGHLSGGIAHDFNNLLTVIIGGAEALQSALGERPELKRVADSIFAAGNRGAELTQRLLAFGRRQMLRPDDVDCGGMVAHVRTMLSRMLRANVRIETHVDENLWNAYVDPAQLESALLNLAINSQHAMPEGGVLAFTAANITLDQDYRDSHLEVPAGDYIVVAVTDTGEGMTPEVRARAFDPFFTTRDVGQGSGLGLSMVYGFVKQSGGHISLYSDPELGTTVRLYLPAHATKMPATAAGEPDRNGEVPGGGETILVVEDDIFVRSYATLVLDSLGYRVLAAETGAEGLKILAENPGVDLVFTDIVLPDKMSGWQMAETIRGQHPQLPILFTSGYDREAVSRQKRSKPTAPFISKPYRKPELARLIREILDRARAAG